MTMAQQDRVEDMRQFATTLQEQQHYAINEITDRCQSVLDRYKRLLDSMAARKKKLEDSKNYQLFLRHLYEVRRILKYMLNCVKLSLIYI
jgi:hypothetical protein